MGCEVGQGCKQRKTKTNKTLWFDAGSAPVPNPQLLPLPPSQHWVLTPLPQVWGTENIEELKKTMENERFLQWEIPKKTPHLSPGSSPLTGEAQGWRETENKRQKYRINPPKKQRTVCVGGLRTRKSPSQYIQTHKSCHKFGPWCSLPQLLR